MLKTILSENGPLHNNWPGFEARPNQFELASRIEDALQQAHSLLLEAPTGTGKTLAYLLPALLSPRRIILSVGNRTLQDHLWWGEYQKLRATVPDLRPIYLLKGCENYLCLQQMERSLEAGNRVLGEHWQTVQRWAQQTRDGEVQTLPITAQQLEALRSNLTVTADQCQGTRCAHFETCFFQKARHRASHADVLLINHTLLLSDNRLFEKGMGALLPEADSVIVDEAHQLPELLMRSNMEMVDGYRVKRWLKAVRKAVAEQSNLFPEIPRLLKRFESIWQKIHDQLGQTDRADELISVSAHSLVPLLNQWDALLAQLQCMHQAQVDLGELIAQLMRWIQVIRNAQANSGVLYCRISKQQLNVFSARLQSPFSSLNQESVNWLFLSATLKVENRFDYFRQMLLLPELDDFSSDDALDYSKRSVLCVPSHLPLPDDEAFYPRWVQTVEDLYETVAGGILLLFSSHQALQTCADLLQGKTERTCYVYQAGSNRQALLQQFRQDGNGVLLATGSFWEGIDVQGTALSCVAIDKLPFIPPSDMLALVWQQMAKESQQNWFNDYMVPHAIMRLRQGVGRLLRSRHDSGLLVLGDRRLLVKPYGLRFMASLPNIPLVETLEQAAEQLAKIPGCDVNLKPNLR